MPRRAGFGKGPYTFNDVKLQWLALLCQDESLSSTAIVVSLYVITVHYNQDKGKAWPSFATIAYATGKSVKTVQRAIKELDGTWFDIERGNGQGHSTTYAPSDVSVLAAISLRQKHDKVVRLHPVKGGQGCPERVSGLSSQGGRESPPNPEIESRNKKTARLFVEFGSAQGHSWNAWLIDHDMKNLEELRLSVVKHDRPGCYMPSRYPPTDTREIKIVLQHLQSTCAQTGSTKTNSHNI